MYMWEDKWWVGQQKQKSVEGTIYRWNKNNITRCITRTTTKNAGRPADLFKAGDSTILPFSFMSNTTICFHAYIYIYMYIYMYSICVNCKCLLDHGISGWFLTWWEPNLPGPTSRPKEIVGDELETPLRGQPHEAGVSMVMRAPPIAG